MAVILMEGALHVWESAYRHRWPDRDRVRVIPRFLRVWGTHPAYMAKSPCKNGV